MSKKRKALQYIFILFGVILLSYPLVAKFIEERRLLDAVSSYTKEIEKETTKNNLEEIKRKAQEYNQALFDGDTTKTTHSIYWNSMLGSDKAMATIKIPKINTDLPIFHGTEEDILKVGVGHIEGTSLPIGGSGTRSVISGHRGLPNSDLFTRLDEITIGDKFFIKSLGDTLAYEVKDIQTVLPDDMSIYGNLGTKDEVVLVTCTPFGINSHRLLVYGERVDYIPEDEEYTRFTAPSLRQVMFTYLPMVILGIICIVVIIKIFKYIRRKKNETK